MTTGSEKSGTNASGAAFAAPARSDRASNRAWNGPGASEQ